MEGGKTDEYIKSVPAGFLDHDMHFSKLALSVNVAPGAGKSGSVALSDGTSTMLAILSGSQTEVITTANAFDLDVSAEDLNLSYTQTAGGSITKATIMWVHYEIPNV